MNIKDIILSKSNSYNYYKAEYEKMKEKYDPLLEENAKLKKEKNTRRLESLATSFCDGRFHDYSFREDFPVRLYDFLKNFPEDSRKRAIQLFLRANATYLLSKDTLFTDEEID